MAVQRNSSRELATDTPMILPDTELAEWALSGGITPFEPGNMNPASIDLRWSGRYMAPSPNGWEARDSAELFALRPGVAYLLDTLETVNVPNTLAGLLTLKSSLARQGVLLSHAGWFDPGFHGTSTFTLLNASAMPVALHRGQRVVQLILMRLVSEPARDYRQTGRYAGQSEPTAAR